MIKMFKEIKDKVIGFDLAVAYWKKLTKSEEKSSITAILQCLAFHIESGNHKLGLTKYETYDQSPVGVDDKAASSKFFKKKTEKVTRGYRTTFNKLIDARIIRKIGTGKWRKKRC